MTDIREAWGLRKIVNAAGPVSVYGGGAPGRHAAEAAAAILPVPVQIAELQELAGRRIAEAFGSESGCVTAGSAAAIAIAVAATMTGTDAARIAQLPDASGMKRGVVLQRGQDANFGTPVSQMIRLAGAEPRMIGGPSGCSVSELQAALGPDTAAAVYVISHHAAQSGMIGLSDFCAICRAAGVPAIVDAAGEHDLGEPISAGADLAIASAHKNYGALTAGIVAGRRDLIAACLAQDSGIGRPMKVGKEGIAGAIAALGAWRRDQRREVHATWTRRAQLAVDVLSGVPGLRTELAQDIAGSPLWRARVFTGDAAQIVQDLERGEPSIRVWRLGLPHGYFELDPREIDDTEMAAACRAIARLADSNR